MAWQHLGPARSHLCLDVGNPWLRLLPLHAPLLLGPSPWLLRSFCPRLQHGPSGIRLPRTVSSTWVGHHTTFVMDLRAVRCSPALTTAPASTALPKALPPPSVAPPLPSGSPLPSQGVADASPSWPSKSLKNFALHPALHQLFGWITPSAPPKVAPFREGT